MTAPKMEDDTDAMHALCVLVLSRQMGKLTDDELIRHARVIFSAGMKAGGEFVLAGVKAPALKICN